MKYLLIISALLLSLSSVAQDENKDWESLDLEDTHIREMEQEHLRNYQDREGDLQIQAEEEEIIPLESEDSRYLQESQSSKED